MSGLREVQHSPGCQSQQGSLTRGVGWQGRPLLPGEHGQAGEWQRPSPPAHWLPRSPWLQGLKPSLESQQGHWLYPQPAAKAQFPSLPFPSADAQEPHFHGDPFFSETLIYLCLIVLVRASSIAALSLGSFPLCLLPASFIPSRGQPSFSEAHLTSRSQAWGSWRWLLVTPGKHSASLAWGTNVTWATLLGAIVELSNQTLGLVPGAGIGKRWPQAGIC